MDKRSFPIYLVIESGDRGRMTNTTESTTTTGPPPADGNERQARIIAKALRKKTFATLATVSPKGRSHSAGVVYDFVDGALWIHTMRDGRKGRNIAHNRHVGICVPYRRLPVGPPFTLHFQGVAELVPLDDPEAVRHYEAGRLDSISGHGAMEMDGACFVRITPTGMIHSFGPGVPVLDLARNPLENRRPFSTGRHGARPHLTANRSQREDPMETTARSALLIYTVVAAGINSGAFFVFSNFVMASLGRLAPADGARAMQEINRGAPNPLFMATLIGGGVAGAVLAATAPGDPGARWQVAGGLLSLATTLITMVFHVPRNNRLDRVDADSPEGQAVWADYLVSWTRGNHVRTVTATLSVICLLLAAAS